MDIVTMEQAQRRLGEIREQISIIAEDLPLKEHETELTILRKERDTLLRQLPALHVASLTDPASVYEDARRFLPDAIKYIYLDALALAKIGIITIPKEDRPALIAVRFMPFNRFSKPVERIVASFEHLDMDPDAAPLLLEATYTKQWIINELLKDHLKALEGKPERKRLIVDIDRIIEECPYIRAKTASTLISDTSALTPKDMLPIYHYSAFDKMAALRKSDFVPDYVANGSTYESGNDEEYFSMIIKGIEEYVPSVPVNCHKLFVLALALFTRQNPNLKKNKPCNNNTVFITIDWYINLLGLHTSRREARRSIRNDLKTLYNASITIKSKRFGRGEFRLIQAYAMNPSFISITFGSNNIDFFAKLPQTQAALWLLRIDGASPNVYSIANKLVTHASMKNNQRKGTNNKLSVSSLLAVTHLPTAKDLMKRGKDGKTAMRHWRKRVQQPFEKALNEILTLQTGGLLSWHYALPGSDGKKLSPDEVRQIPTLQDYSRIMVVYELAYMPTYTAANGSKATQDTAVEND